MLEVKDNHSGLKEDIEDYVQDKDLQETIDTYTIHDIQGNGIITYPSRRLSTEELLRHACSEWSVEAMHWLLNVHFGKDFCRVEDKYVQRSLSIVRKIVLNSMKIYKAKYG